MKISLAESTVDVDRRVGGDVPDFSVARARAAAAAGRIDAWVDAFLTSSERGANVPLALGLRKQRRWWIGPIEIPLGSLERTCGPEPEMPYCTTVEAWEARVSAIAAAAVHPEALPPLILEFRESRLVVCDGNHRHEALRRRGASRTWALVWCNSEADLLSARAMLGAG